MATTLSRRIRRLKIQPAFAGWSPKDLSLLADRLTLRIGELRRARKAKDKASQ